MAVVELLPYDLYTSRPERLYALQPLWANMASLGARSARLLVVTDHINDRAALHGFDKVAVPFGELVRDLRWYRSYYEQYLRDTIRETQYIRLFLILASSLDDTTLRRVIEGYGIGTRSLDRDGVPLPFVTAVPHWDYAVDETGRYWGAVQSALDQTGAVVAQTLHKLFALDFPVYAAIDVWNYSRTDAVRLLKTKAAVASVHFSKGHEQRLEASEAQKAVDAFRREMGTAGVGLHELRLTIAVSGNSVADLESRFELVRGACALDLGKRRAQVTVMEQMFSAEPPAHERHGTLATSTHVTVLTGSALSYSRPTKMDGVLLGFDAAQSPVVIDLFDRHNKAYNAVVVGQTGSGKTFFTLLLMIRSLLTGARLIIIDPKGDIDLSWLGHDHHGRALCRTVRVGSAGCCLNILDPIFPEVSNQIEFVLGGLRLLGVYRPDERLKQTLLDTALYQLYEARDETKETPTLIDLRQQVIEIGSTKEGAIAQDAAELAFALEPFTAGSRAELFGRPTNIDLSLSAPVNIFDVSRFPSRQTGGAMRSMLFATLFGLINQAILNRRQRPQNPDLAPIIFFVDEIGVLMRDPVVADYTSDKYKTARSLRVSMIVADQTVASLLGAADEQGIRHGHEMFANAPYRFLFFQEDSEMSTLATQFPMMPDAYRQRIHRLPRGQCVAQTPQGIFNILVTPSEMEKVVLGSNLTERTRAQQLITRLKQELRE